LTHFTVSEKKFEEKATTSDCLSVMMETLEMVMDEMSFAMLSLTLLALKETLHIQIFVQV